MSVVTGFVKRNRYSTEATECRKGDAILLNLIYLIHLRVHKCVCIYSEPQLDSIQPFTAELKWSYHATK